MSSETNDSTMAYFSDSQSTREQTLKLSKRLQLHTVVIRRRTKPGTRHRQHETTRTVLNSESSFTPTNCLTPVGSNRLVLWGAKKARIFHTHSGATCPTRAQEKLKGGRGAGDVESQVVEEKRAERNHR